VDADFPAAHSMDTHWFAVDREGRVGLFFTGENGFVPQSAVEADSQELVGLCQQLAGTSPPGVDEEENDVEDWDEFLGALVEQGFFYYNYADTFDDPEPLLLPFALWGVPDKPLHVGQLPPEWRARCGRCVIDSASFGAAEQIQPLEFTTDDPVAYWEDSCAYLSSDETVIRPIAGREEKYQEFCVKYADRLRKGRQGIRIEGLDEGAGSQS
jgi:hypothetical protein